MATYVISDIHGCFDEFQKMLRKISFSDEDTLYLAGDYIDRGLQSLKMLRWLDNLPCNVFPIKGNHDVEFAENIRIMREMDEGAELMTDPTSNEDAVALYETVKYELNKKSSVAAKYFDYYGTIGVILRKEGVTFGELCHFADTISGFPFLYRFLINNRSCIVVHAGYIEDLEPVKEKYETIEEFYIYARQEGIEYGGVEHGLVISGHTPTIHEKAFSYNDGEVYRYYDEAKDCIFYDIDCGCAYYSVHPSATLACIRLEDEEVFYL